jgi:ribosomal RNA assembly protein
MIKRELSKYETLKGENWDRFLPKFKKQNQPKPKKSEDQKEREKEGKEKSKKRVYTPFPPAQTPRKIDLAIESGEHFLKPAEKAAKAMKKKMEAQHDATEKKKAERAKQYVAPKEDLKPVKEKPAPKSEPASSIEQLKEKFRLQGEEKKRKLAQTTISESLSDYIVQQPSKKRKQ